MQTARSRFLKSADTACSRKNRTRSNPPLLASTGFCIQNIRRNIGTSPWALFRMRDARRQDK